MNPVYPTKYSRIPLSDRHGPLSDKALATGVRSRFPQKTEVISIASNPVVYPGEILVSVEFISPAFTIV